MLMVVAMLYVEKDLSQCVKVAFDKWDTDRDFLNHRYFYVANIRISPRQFSQAIEKGHDPESLYNLPSLPPSLSCLSFPSPLHSPLSHVPYTHIYASILPYPPSHSQFPHPRQCHAHILIYILNINSRVVSGRKCTYTVIPTTGVPDRDIMFKLYNAQGMYGTQPIPDPNLLALGIKFHSVEDFVRERLIPHLGIGE